MRFNLGDDNTRKAEPSSSKTTKAVWVLAVLLAVVGGVAVVSANRPISEVDSKSVFIQTDGDSTCPVTLPVGTIVRLENQEKAGEYLETCGTDKYAYLSSSGSTTSEFKVYAARDNAACSYSFESVAHPGSYLGYYGKNSDIYLMVPNPLVNHEHSMSFLAQVGKSGTGVSLRNIGGYYFGISSTVGTAPGCPATKVATMPAASPVQSISWNIISAAKVLSGYYTQRDRNGAQPNCLKIDAIADSDGFTIVPCTDVLRHFWVSGSGKVGADKTGVIYLTQRANVANDYYTHPVELVENGLTINLGAVGNPKHTLFTWKKTSDTTGCECGASL